MSTSIDWADVAAKHLRGETPTTLDGWLAHYGLPSPADDWDDRSGPRPAGYHTDRAVNVLMQHLIGNFALTYEVLNRIVDATGARVTEGMRPITLGWDDPDEADEVAHVLEAAALGPDGKVRDHGFHEDAVTIRKQADALRAEELRDEADEIDRG